MLSQQLKGRFVPRRRTDRPTTTENNLRYLSLTKAATTKEKTKIIVPFGRTVTQPYVIHAMEISYVKLVIQYQEGSNTAWLK